MTEEEFFEYIKIRCNKELTNEQKNAVIYSDGNHCVQSTAGSGKTTVICCKIAYLILVKGIDPSEIAVVSFSKLSAGDIKKRFISLFGDIISEEIRFSTIHSFANSIINEFGKLKNINYRVIENSRDVNKKSLLKDIAEEYAAESIDDEVLNEIISFLSFVRNMMILKDDLSLYENVYPIDCFKEIYIKYSEILNQNKYLDYDTQLTMAYHILNTNSELREKYQNQYKYYLCDESQDNSKIQNAILRVLSGKGTICMVGDLDQLIYGWRGVDFEEFKDFNKLFTNSKVLFMDQNFRSSGNVVYLANKFIKINKNRYDKNIFTINKDGADVTTIDVNSKAEQMDYVIKTLSKCNGNYNNYAILYRNNISAIEVASKLINNNIPFYVKEELNSFFNNFIVRDILNLIEFAKNQSDIEKFISIYNKTYLYIKKDIINKIKFNESKSAIECLLNSSLINEKSKTQVESLKQDLKKLLIIKPSEAIEFIEEELGYSNYLKWYSDKFNYPSDGIEYILSTLKSICNTTNDIKDLKEKLSLIQEAIKAAQDNKYKNSVKLTTIHSSKGLEWEEVFVIDTHMIPTKAAVKEKEEGIMKGYEEEVRTFFVAITRPKHKLHIIQPNTINGKVIGKSPFVEIVKSILKQQKVEDKRRKDIDQYVLDVNNFAASNYNNKNKYTLEDFKIGTKINHKSFGIGEFIKINYDILIGTVKLKNGTIKNISLNTCIKGIVVNIIS